MRGDGIDSSHRAPTPSNKITDEGGRGRATGIFHFPIVVPSARRHGTGPEARLPGISLSREGVAKERTRERGQRPCRRGKRSPGYLERSAVLGGEQSYLKVPRHFSRQAFLATIVRASFSYLRSDRSISATLFT